MMKNEDKSSSELDELMKSFTNTKFSTNEKEDHFVQHFVQHFFDSATTPETKGLRGVSRTQSILESINAVN